MRATPTNIAWNPNSLTRVPLRAGPEVKLMQLPTKICFPFLFSQSGLFIPPLTPDNEPLGNPRVFQMNATLTDCKPETEGNIPNSIDPAIHRAVPKIHQVPQLRHHGAVHHANCKPKASHGDDQLSWPRSKRNLKRNEE